MRSTAPTVVSDGKSMSLSRVLLAIWKPETDWSKGIEIFVRAVLLVTNRSWVIRVRLFACIRVIEVC